MRKKSSTCESLLKKNEKSSNHDWLSRRSVSNQNTRNAEIMKCLRHYNSTFIARIFHQDNGTAHSGTAHSVIWVYNQIRLSLETDKKEYIQLGVCGGPGMPVSNENGSESISGNEKAVDFKQTINWWLFFSRLPADWAEDLPNLPVDD